MISNITRGTSFGGLLSYALNQGELRTEGKEAELIGGNMTGSTVADLAREFSIVRRLRPDIVKPVWHESLRSVAGENISPEQWNEIARSHMKQLGFSENHPFVIVQHMGEDHIHIVASRIGIDSQLYYGKNENLIASRDCRRIEIEFGLQKVRGPEYELGKDGVHRIISPAADTIRLRSNEIKMKARTGRKTPREELQTIITKCLTKCKSFEQYEQNLQQARVLFVKSSNGYSYECEGIAFKGSQLGKKYSYANIKGAIELAQLYGEKQLLYQATQNNRRQSWQRANHLKRMQNRLMWRGGIICRTAAVALMLARIANWLMERRRTRMLAEEHAAVVARVSKLKSAKQEMKIKAKIKERNI